MNKPAIHTRISRLLPLYRLQDEPCLLYTSRSHLWNIIHVPLPYSLQGWHLWPITRYDGTLYGFHRSWSSPCGCLLYTSPLIGVCLPSLGITAGARRLATKSSACLRMVANPFSAIYLSLIHILCFCSQDKTWLRYAVPWSHVPHILLSRTHNPGIWISSFVT